MREEALIDRSNFVEQIQNALQTLKSDAPTWKAAILDRIEYYQRCEADAARLKADLDASTEAMKAAQAEAREGTCGQSRGGAEEGEDVHRIRSV